MHQNTEHTHTHTRARARARARAHARTVLIKNIASYGNRKIVTLIKIDINFILILFLSLKFKIKINARNIKIFIPQSRAGMI